MPKSHTPKGEVGIAWLKKFVKAVAFAPRRRGPSIRSKSDGAPSTSHADCAPRIETHSAPRKQGRLIDLERRAKFRRVRGMVG